MAPASGPAAASINPTGHPKNQWETAYVWAFIMKFTQLKKTIDGLDSVIDLEEALVFPAATPVLDKLLQFFIRQCKPKTHLKLESSTVHKHVLSLIGERATGKDHVWYDEKTNQIVNPFLDVDVYAAPWPDKLELLRQLVDWQIVSVPSIKQDIEKTRALKPKKPRKSAPHPPANGAPAEPAAPDSDEETEQVKQALLIEPIGFDLKRNRYWILDDSGRMYKSSNPWKYSCPFLAVSSNKEELEQEVNRLAAELAEHNSTRSVPMTPGNMTKWEQGMQNMITKIQTEILPRVEIEEARVNKLRKKAEAKQAQMAQAELRTTRTRRQTKKVEYYQEHSEEDDGDEFIDDGEGGFESDFSVPGGTGRAKGRPAQGTRRSGRIQPQPSNEWRGERRSTRLGGPNVDDSSVSAGPSGRPRRDTGATVSTPLSGPLAEGSVPLTRSPTPTSPVFDEEEAGAERLFAQVARDKNQKKEEELRKYGGLAKPREGEVIVEAPKGKKKSKFWFYAVEPVPAPSAIPDPPSGRRKRRKIEPIEEAAVGTPVESLGPTISEDISMTEPSEAMMIEPMEVLEEETKLNGHATNGTNGTTHPTGAEVVSSWIDKANGRQPDPPVKEMSIDSDEAPMDISD